MESTHQNKLGTPLLPVVQLFFIPLLSKTEKKGLYLTIAELLSSLRKELILSQKSSPGFNQTYPSLFLHIHEMSLPF